MGFLRFLPVAGTRVSVGVGLLMGLTGASGDGSSNWVQTGIWVGAGIVLLILLAFFLAHIAPKNDDTDNSPL